MQWLAHARVGLKYRTASLVIVRCTRTLVWIESETDLFEENRETDEFGFGLSGFHQVHRDSDVHLISKSPTSWVPPFLAGSSA
jgi:hypothetical protein